MTGDTPGLAKRGGMLMTEPRSVIAFRVVADAMHRRVDGALAGALLGAREAMGQGDELRGDRCLYKDIDTNTLSGKATFPS